MLSFVFRQNISQAMGKVHEALVDLGLQCWFKVIETLGRRYL